MLKGDLFLILAGFCAASGVISIYLRVFRKNDLGTKKWFVYVVILLAIIGASTPFILGYGWFLRTKEISALTGQIESPIIDPSKAFEIHVGGVTFHNSISDLEEGINMRNLVRTIFDIGYDYPLWIYFRDNEILVSVEIMNENNETLAIINDNQWAVHNNKLLVYDRNYNDFAFEVIDSEQHPILQVYLKQGNKVYIGGIFRLPHGLKMIVTPGSTTITNIENVDIDYIRIFKYPSANYLKQLEPEAIAKLFN